MFTRRQVLPKCRSRPYEVLTYHTGSYRAKTRQVTDIHIVLTTFFRASTSIDMSVSRMIDGGVLAGGILASRNVAT